MPSEKVTGALAVLGIDVPEEEFEHAGVKGMRWGVRKDRSTSPADARAQKIDQAVTKATNKAVAKADRREIKKIANEDARETANRLKGISRIVKYEGDAKKANRAATASSVNSILKGLTLTAITAGAVGVTAGTAVAIPGVAVAGVAIVAGLAATGKLSQTVKDIRNVNAASGVFNPNTLLTRQNNN